MVGEESPFFFRGVFKRNALLNGKYSWAVTFQLVYPHNKKTTLALPTLQLDLLEQ